MLVRLQDVIHELDRQLAPLAEQARVANLYNECQEQLQGLEARLIRSQFTKAAAKRDAIAATIIGLQAGKETAITKAGLMADELKELEEALKKRKESINAREQESGQVRQQFQEAQVEFARVEEKYAHSLSRQAELRVRLQVIAQKDQEIAVEIQQIASQRQQCCDQRASTEQRCRELETTLAEREQAKQQVNQEWEKNNGELFEVLHQKTLLASQVKELQNKKDTVRRQQENLRQKSSENAARIVQIREQAEEKTRLLNEKSALLAETLEELEQAQERAAAISREREQIVPAIQKQLQENERCKTRLHMMQESEKNREGYQGGVRAILQARARGEAFCSGIHGLVEELFTIPPGVRNGSLYRPGTGSPLLRLRCAGGRPACSGLFKEAGDRQGHLFAAGCAAALAGEGAYAQIPGARGRNRNHRAWSRPCQLWGRVPECGRIFAGTHLFCR